MKTRRGGDGIAAAGLEGLAGAAASMRGVGEGVGGGRGGGSRGASGEDGGGEGLEGVAASGGKTAEAMEKAKAREVEDALLTQISVRGSTRRKS